MSGTSNKTRRIIAFALLCAHLAVITAQGFAGINQPFETFNLLLFTANVVIAVIVARGGGDLLLGAGSMFLIMAHAAIGSRLAPDSLTSGAMLMVNLIVLYVGLKLNRHMPPRYWYAFVAGYFLLFFTFVVAMSNAEALFLLFALGLAACSRSMRLLACFWCVTFGFTFCQPYAWEFTFLSIFIVVALFGARGRLHSRTAVIFLGAGLALLFLVLLPIVIVLLGENPHNLIRTLRDERVRSAIGVTLITATISTVFLAAFTVPLAYAISRLRFPGRTLLLSLMDVPIVVPQSVAGIALVSVLGRQQVIGQSLYNVFGVQFDGTMLGICAAQIFVAMPFIARPAVAAFDSVPEGMEMCGRTLGASSFSAFRRIALPLASRGVFLGAVLAWARATGEFGALLFIAPTPESAPVAAWNRFNSVGMVETAPLVALLLLFSMVMFILLQLATRALPSPHGVKEPSVGALA